MTSVLNFDKLKDNLSKSADIKNVEINKNGNIEIIFNDDLKILAREIIGGDHMFYTWMEPKRPEYFYVGLMPHNSFIDLYQEINRMSKPEKRKTMCKTNYFKSY